MPFQNILLRMDAKSVEAHEVNYAHFPRLSKYPFGQMYLSGFAYFEIAYA